MMQYFWLGQEADQPQGRAITHSARAAAELLERYAARLRAGESGSDMPELVQIAEVITRRL